MSPLILLGRLQGSLGRQRNIVVMLTAMLLLGMGGNSGAIPHDVRNVEPGHHEGRCRFEAIVSKYRLEVSSRRSRHPAIIEDRADVAQELYGRSGGWGLEAIAEGFRYLGLKDDHEVLAKEFIVYDALYAYCQEEVNAGLIEDSPL